jgi:hypothetical protein
MNWKVQDAWSNRSCGLDDEVTMPQFARLFAEILHIVDLASG